MSLDVYLKTAPDLGGDEPVEVTLFEANVTHNLGMMAAEAGVYKAIWRPEEIGARSAGDLIERLTIGLALLKSDPKRFAAHNPPNGWGTYTEFVPWVERYLEACRLMPLAEIEVSR